MCRDQKEGRLEPGTRKGTSLGLGNPEATMVDLSPPGSNLASNSEKVATSGGEAWE